MEFWILGARSKRPACADTSTAKAAIIAALQKKRPASEGRPYKNLKRFALLAADVDGAEAQDYVATRGGTTEAKHRTEAREDQHLVELMT